MTAHRMPVLTCDAPRCDRTTWTFTTHTIPALRQLAATHGWVRYDRRDWCHTHAAQIGIRRVS